MSNYRNLCAAAEVFRLRMTYGTINRFIRFIAYVSNSLSARGINPIWLFVHFIDGLSNSDHEVSRDRYSIGTRLRGGIDYFGVQFELFVW